MKMHSLALEGYRRFNTKQTLNLDGRVTAILGPNESGKTSILSALRSIGSNETLVTVGPASVISKGQKYENNHIVIELKCLLSQEDKEQFKEVVEANDVRWACILKKYASNSVEIILKPEVHRNKERNYSAKKMKKVLDRVLGDFFHAHPLPHPRHQTPPRRGADARCAGVNRNETGIPPVLVSCLRLEPRDENFVQKSRAMLPACRRMWAREDRTA